ncbi:hypothetical protein ADU59_28460 [Pararhizobium polonicum]|uniref:Metallo-beta-lactamase domain-containing protein n=1 Tax=Pararhizobium polonicum TaxID=1612624 RepID=A0A1C7NT34_9HYPH|nr:MBL fold metallo-hydrolase [Pararhizobium polonicum]OBZ92137.1 hypothetical protein ADU59_28460 [Pararhizobium polonicum]
MRIAKDTYLVASGVQGCSLTDDFDCNCYLFDTGEGLVLFDTGAGRAMERIYAEIERDGLSLGGLTHVFLTHGHADHSAGAAAIVAEHGAKLLCGADTAAVMAAGEKGISLDKARAAGVYPPDYTYRSPRPDGIVAPGEAMTIGRMTVTPVSTPGHSADHMSYIVELGGVTSLVSGDALFHSGRIIYQATDDFDVAQSCGSIESLAARAFDALLPGHGMFVLSGGTRHAQVAMASIRSMKPPVALDLANI